MIFTPFTLKLTGILKKLFTIYILALSLSCVGQQSVENKLTSAHLNVKGTKVSLIPPSGFEISTSFAGFQKNELNASIMVIEMPGPFSEVSKGFTPEGFASQSVIIDTIVTYTINGLPGVLASGQQNAYGIEFNKMILAFGSEKETILLSSAYNAEFPEAGNEILAAMLSVVYDSEKAVNPFETIDFTLTISKSKLIFARNIANTLIFTRDGQIPTSLPDKTTLVISKSISETPITDRQKFAEDRLYKLPYEILEITTHNNITIDDLPGIEIIALCRNNKSGEKEKIIQTILFTDARYYILIGSTNQKFDSNMQLLKEDMLTFRRK